MRSGCGTSITPFYGWTFAGGFKMLRQAQIKSGRRLELSFQYGFDGVRG